MSWIWDNILQVFFGLNKTLGYDDTLLLRDEFTAKAMLESDDMIQRLMVDGDITIQRWTLDMRTLIKDTYRAQYELGIGGVNNMDFFDYGHLGGILRPQYGFLQNFAEDMRQGKVSPKQAMNRARMYINSSTQAYERAKATANGLTLPQYPGDGNTVCKSNCKCRWDIVDVGEAHECTWSLGIAEHCPDCIVNSVVWNPLIIPKFIEIIPLPTNLSGKKQQEVVPTWVWPNTEEARKIAGIPKNE